MELIWVQLCILIIKKILILGKGPTQGLDDNMLTSEGQYSVNFSRSNWKFCLNLHYNRNNSFLFNATKIYQFKANDPEIKYPLCFGNISKDFTAIKHEKTGLNAYVYKFSVDYNIIDTSTIINIHKYFNKKPCIT